MTKEIEIKQIKKRIENHDIEIKSLKDDSMENVSQALEIVLENHSESINIARTESNEKIDDLAKNFAKKIDDLKNQQVINSQKQIIILENILGNVAMQTKGTIETNKNISKLYEKIGAINKDIEDLPEIRDSIDFFDKIKFMYTRGKYIIFASSLLFLLFLDKIIGYRDQIYEAIKGMI